MRYSYFHEDTQRGTADFPIDYYKIHINHPRYHMQTHWHKDIEIIRINEGTLEAQIGDTPYTLKKGDSIYIPGGVAHGAEPVDCDYECMVFSPVIMYVTQKIRTIIKSKIVCPVKFHNNQFINDAFDSFLFKQNGSELNVISALYKTAYSAMEKQTPAKNNIEYRIDRIKPSISYIENNFSTGISLQTLAEECSMSSNYFCKIFKDITGQTPVEYITTYRIEAACEMLLSGASVTDTAYDCGFNDLSYFIHVFKKTTGISPKQYSQIKK